MAEKLIVSHTRDGGDPPKRAKRLIRGKGAIKEREMPKHLILLKITAIVFGTIPFGLIGLFYIIGGPDPGASILSPLRFIGIPLFLAGVFWALPETLLLKVKAGIGNILLLYILPGAFACLFFLWLIFSSENPSYISLGLFGFFVLAGIGSAAGYHFKVRKVEEEWDYIKSK
jgi:hypothetical protein